METFRQCDGATVVANVVAFVFMVIGVVALVSVL